MAFNNHARSSSASFRHPAFDYSNTHAPAHAQPQNPSTTPPALDPIEWYPHLQNCRRFFLDHSQHSPLIQAVAAFMNILLPFQHHPNPVVASSRPAHPPSSSPGDNDVHVSLVPYLRRLVVTGLDTPPLLHSFFGDDWTQGVGPLHDLERRNYLFAAKSASWLDVKASYEPSPAETVPCMAPLRSPSEAEILAAEARWSEWLALQDWMVGPRAPALEDGAADQAGFQGQGQGQIKREAME